MEPITGQELYQTFLKYRYSGVDEGERAWIMKANPFCQLSSADQQAYNETANNLNSRLHVRRPQPADPDARPGGRDDQ